MPRLPKYFRMRDGHFYVVKWHRGKVRWKSFGSNRPEAIRLGTMWLERLAREKYLAGQPMLLRNVCSLWVELCGRSSRALRCAESRFEHMLYPTLGEVVVTEIRKSQLLALRAELTRKGYAVESIRSAMGDLRCVLNFAVEAEITVTSPSFRSCLPREPERAPDRLSDEEVARLLAKAKEPWKWAMELSLLTGIRWGELHSLRWDRVLWKPKPALVLEFTKSGRVRRVPLCIRAAQILTAERFGSRGDFVFPLRGKSPSNTAVRLTRQTGIRFHWHMLRHTFACRWLESGGSKETLQELLGHQSITMTERYGKLSEEAVFAAMDRMETTGFAAKTLAEA